MGSKLITLSESLMKFTDSNLLKLSVGGVDLKVLVDSGATNNIIDENNWEAKSFL